MKPIPVLGIPHYNRPDLTFRAIHSIDYPVENLVVVNNNPPKDFPWVWFENDLTSNPLVKNFKMISHPNAGVAGAWNEIIKLFPAPWWLIVNNDIQFTPGDLEKMAAQAGDTERAAGIYYGNHGASWFAITARGVEAAGLFDENIFPAYLEDCDMSRRMDLLGIKRLTVPGCNAIHGDGKLTGSCTVNSDPLLQHHNGRTHANNFKYYRAKWGGDNEKEIYTTPFNDPHWPVWAWKFEPAMRAANQWK
jgi:GT2 family glycosyltransferase